MGVCNGYRYHDLRRPVWIDVKLVLASLRGQPRAEREWRADDEMLLEIAAKPDDREMY